MVIDTNHALDMCRSDTDNDVLDTDDDRIQYCSETIAGEGGAWGLPVEERIAFVAAEIMRADDLSRVLVHVLAVALSANSFHDDVMAGISAAFDGEV